MLSWLQLREEAAGRRVLTEDEPDPASVGTAVWGLQSAADRIIDHPGYALQQRTRFRRDTVLIVGGTLVPNRDHTIAEHPIGRQRDDG